MIHFLNKELVFAFHADLIRQYGGSPGLRDDSLLDSALAQPETTLDGVFLHPTIPAMAAAFAFHLCKNHPFMDGNKRIALVAMTAYLYRNGYKVNISEKEMYLLIMGVADGSISKEELTEFLEQRCEAK